MGFGVRKKAAIALAALLAVTVAACGIRAAADARDAAGAAQQPAAEGGGIVAVEGPGGDAASVLGGEQAAAALDREVAAWCAANVEDAGCARWNGKVACDFRTGAFELAYLCDDDGATAVRVVAHPAQARYEISKAAA